MYLYFKELPAYLNELSDNIGLVTGLSVVVAQESQQKYGSPLSIKCQVNMGFSDTVNATGKLGEIAKESCMNVRSNFKNTFEEINAPRVSYEMHIQYIQTHSGVEGDSASLAMDIGLLSDFIKAPVNPHYAVTGSLAGDAVIAVGGVTEKISSVMDPELNMIGVCVPWQNRKDIEPLLINTGAEIIAKDGVPGIRIYRSGGTSRSFDIYFCKKREDAYKVMLGMDMDSIGKKMYLRTFSDFKKLQDTPKTMEQSCCGLIK